QCGDVRLHDRRAGRDAGAFEAALLKIVPGTIFRKIVPDTFFPIGVGFPSQHTRKEPAMCHDWEFEMVRKAYLEQTARRKRDEEAAAKKPAPTATPASTPAEAPRAKDKEPVPA